MRLEIEIVKRKFLCDVVNVASDKAVEIESLVKKVFARDSFAKIAFDAVESAHMGYESYDIYKDSSLDNLIKDQEKGIAFKIRIEMVEGIITSSTSNPYEYSFSPVVEMTENEIEELFQELLK